MRLFLTSLLQLSKIFKMSSSVKIGTHDGTFHADEALACYMLRKIPEYANAEIVRSRDSNVLESCDLVLDVGGVYDASAHRYDHHQDTFNHTIQTLRPSVTSSIRLSSAGLVYHHFGEKILESVLEKRLDNVYLEKVFSYVYFHFIQEIDAVDNGIPMYDIGEPKYSFGTNLSTRVSHLNPPWNAPNGTSMMELFKKAMVLVGKEFDECVFRFRDQYWPARSIVQEAVDNRFQTYPSGEVIEIQFCPYKSHIFELEKEQNIEGTIKFAIFKDSNGEWRIGTIPKSPGNFLLRLPLYKEWQGLRNEVLQQKSGVSDAIFVHATGFIGGAKTREGALALALKTLEHNNCKNNDTVQ